MTDQSNSPIPSSRSTDPAPEKETSAGTEDRSPAEKIWQRLVHLGLGETALRIGTGVVSLLLVIVVVWVMSSFVLKNQALPTDEPDSTPSALEGAGGPLIDVDSEVINEEILYSGFTVSRLAQVHTDRPASARTEIIEYTIQSGDTLFGIAEKYGLKPQSLLWSNRHILGDDPHNIFPGVSILIPTIDGAVYFWNQGDGLNGVSSFYKVTPDAIIDWPSNNLDRATLGDFALPNIAPGTMLFVPGGEGEFTDWLPHYSRDVPAESSIPGGCGIITEGYIGYGTFIWPTSETYLSGYDYTPETNHRAIDIAGRIGNPIWAVDAGVIVYSGWNTRGYGNLIVVDHGNGWQSVYAHLDTFLAYCGQSVDQGEQIGTLGTTGNSTGPHLHFELRHENYGVVNPWDFLQ